MFKVGQKVVCVEAGNQLLGLTASRWDALLAKGEIYEIRWVGPSIYRGIEYIGVRLQGIDRDDEQDTPFHISRFRPVVERKTSIEIFTKMLTPKRKRVAA